jgi:hypothetical protein
MYYFKRLNTVNTLLLATSMFSNRNFCCKDGKTKLRALCRLSASNLRGVNSLNNKQLHNYFFCSTPVTIT